MIESLGLIPARGGSKGIPRKNIRPLNGKPLIAYTIEAALKSTRIQRVIVSTDDEEIGEIARECGAEFLFLRPNDLALDSTGDLPVIQHAVNWFELHEKEAIKQIVYLRPTTPFKTREIIDTCINSIENHQCSGLRTVTRVQGVHHPYWMYKTENQILRPFCSGIKIEDYFQRQLLPDCLRLNGTVDIILTSNLAQNELYGDRIGYVELDEMSSLDIDSELDFKFAEFILSERLHQ